MPSLGDLSRREKAPFLSVFGELGKDSDVFATKKEVMPYFGQIFLSGSPENWYNTALIVVGRAGIRPRVALRDGARSLTSGVCSAMYWDRDSYSFRCQVWPVPVY